MSGNVQAWIGDMITYLKLDKLKVAKANADRMTKTVQGITVIGAGQMQMSDPSPRIEEARKQYDAARAELNRLRNISLEIEKATRRRDELKQASRGVPVNPELGPAIAKLDQELAELNSQTDAELQKEIAELESKQQALQKAAQECQRTEKQLLQDKANIQLMLRGHETELKNILKEMERSAAAHKAAMAQETCIHCGANHQHWSADKSKASLTAEYEAWLETAKSEQREFEIKIKTEKDRIAAVDGYLSELTTALDGADGINAKLTVIELELDDRKNYLGNIQRDRSAAILAKSKERTGLIATQTRFEQACKEVAGIDGKLAEVERTLAELGSMEAITEKACAASDKADKWSAEIEKLEGLKRDYLRAKADEQRNAQAILEHDRCKAEVEVCQAAIKVLEQVQGDMVKIAFDRILRTVNRFTDGIIKTSIEYRDGEIGRWEGTTWIKHETFSGTETALTYAGIAAALASDAPYRIVMIDEMGIMDIDSMLKVLARMVEMTSEGEIDQFIGCFSGRPLGTLSSINQIAL
jgi:DNA repair exonuclease SbcCD ATPase subunit